MTAIDILILKYKFLILYYLVWSWLTAITALNCILYRFSFRNWNSLPDLLRETSPNSCTTAKLGALAAIRAVFMTLTRANVYFFLLIMYNFLNHDSRIQISIMNNILR